MADYNVQNFKYLNKETGKEGSATMYGKQPSHDHNISAKFTPGAITWLVDNFRWPQAEIVADKFQSHQGKPVAGHELKWDSTLKQWVGSR